MPTEQRSGAFGAEFYSTVLVLAMACGSAAHAQCGAFLPGQGLGGTDGPARDMVTWDPDGPGPRGPTLLLAGVMTRAGGVSSFGHATWDGQQWGTLGTGVSFGNVETVTIWNGQPVLGGSFRQSGLGVPKFNGVARWDGSAWQDLGTGLNNTGDGIVYDLRVWNGDLVAGGLNLVPSGGGSVSGAWRWNGTTWSRLGPASTGFFAIEVRDGVLYGAGGGLVRYNEATNSWDAVAGFPNPGFPIRDIASWGDGLAMIGTQVSGTTATHRSFLYNPAGEFWTTTTAGLSGGNSDVYTVLRVAGGRLYAGGRFTSPTAVSDLAAEYQSVGNRWMPLFINLDAPATAFGEFGGEVIVAGQFSLARKSPDPAKLASRVLRYNRTTGNADPLSPGLTNPVRAMCVHQDRLYTGDSIPQQFQGRPPAHVQYQDAQGLWRVVDRSIDASVTALASINNELYVGGEFFFANNVQRPRVFKVNASGTLLSLSGGISGDASSPNAWVTSFIADGADVIVAGSFRRAFNGVGLEVPANSVVRWNGSAWQTMGSLVNGPFAGLVNDLERFQGDLYALGNFNLADGASAQNFARWNGAAWVPLPGVSGGGVVGACVVGDLLVVAGDFTNVAPSNQPANRVAAWDGAAWQRYDEGLPQGLFIRAIALHQGAPYVASFDGNTQSSTIWKRTNGSWQIAATLQGAVDRMVSHDGSLALGGFLLSASGAPSFGIARWSEPAACCDSIDFNGDSVTPDLQDIIDFFFVFGGGACPTGACSDIDFNNDGVLPDLSDVIKFLDVFAGGAC